MKKQMVALAVMLMAGLGSVSAQSNVTSQDYKTALGVQFYPGAITLKHFFKHNAALVGVGDLWDRGARITGLYEFHGDINGAPGLKWYVGPGAHIGFWDSKWGGGSSFGIDGVLGLDYKFRGAPINASIDWQPSWDFNDNNDGFYGGWGGLARRYVI